MPSRAYTSFLLSKGTVQEEAYAECQCPLGLILHFYSTPVEMGTEIKLVSMPSRAYTSFLLHHCDIHISSICMCVNALSGLYFISTSRPLVLLLRRRKSVSMPSRAYTSFLLQETCKEGSNQKKCQCPLGLIPHFYTVTLEVSSSELLVCQCPLGLIPHFYTINCVWRRRIPVCVSMPSRAYTSFLHI